MYTVCDDVLVDRVSRILYPLCGMQYRIKTDYAAAIFKANLLSPFTEKSDVAVMVYTVLVILRIPSKSLQFRTHPSPTTDSKVFNFQQWLARALHQQMAHADIGSTALSSRSAVTILYTRFGSDNVPLQRDVPASDMSMNIA